MCETEETHDLSPYCPKCKKYAMWPNNECTCEEKENQTRVLLAQIHDIVTFSQTLKSIVIDSTPQDGVCISDVDNAICEIRTVLCKIEQTLSEKPYRLRSYSQNDVVIPENGPW